MSEELRCTVAVCTHNRGPSLERCLASLSRQTFRAFEVLVIDNAHTCHSVRAIADRFEARYAVEPVHGISRARNTGLRLAATPLIAFLDDDCEADPSWLAELLAPFHDPAVMAVTGNILMPRPEFGPEPVVLDRTNPDWFEIAAFGGIGSGGNMAFRASVLDFWPGFDVRLGRGAPLDAGEENQAFLDLVGLGFRLAYAPSAIVTHPATPASLHFRNVARSAAYLTMLIIESPWRGRAFRYAAQALMGTRRSWRPPGNGPSVSLPWWSPLALLLGPWLYLRTVLASAPAPARKPAPLPSPVARG